MQIFISSAYCYQPVIVIKKRGSRSDHNKRLPLYNYHYSLRNNPEKPNFQIKFFYLFSKIFCILKA
jgi:hypothetical protein